MSLSRAATRLLVCAALAAYELRAARHLHRVELSSPAALELPLRAPPRGVRLELPPRRLR